MKKKLDFCPRCGTHLIVTDSRSSMDNYIRRRRECPNDCIERFTTVEIERTEYDALHDTKRELEELKRLLRKAIEPHHVGEA